MIQVRLKNPTLIIAPVSQEEVNKGFGWGSLYVLYKNKNGEVEIGIPDMVEYFPSTANMFGFGEATEKAFFYNGGSSLIESAPTINDRPIYSIQPSDDRKVAAYDIINNVDVKLSDILNGNFKVVTDNIEDNKQPRHM